jgi:hypothetical protein
MIGFFKKNSILLLRKIHEYIYNKIYINIFFLHNFKRLIKSNIYYKIYYFILVL